MHFISWGHNSVLAFHVQHCRPVELRKIARHCQEVHVYSILAYCSQFVPLLIETQKYVV